MRRSESGARRSESGARRSESGARRSRPAIATWRASCVLAASAALLAAPWLGCSGPHQRPPLPAPEYEQPTVAAWDAGRVVDPLEDDAGDWVDDEEAEEAAGAVSAPVDAGPAPDSAALDAAAPGAAAPAASGSASAAPAAPPKPGAR